MPGTETVTVLDRRPRDARIYVFVRLSVTLALTFAFAMGYLLTEGVVEQTLVLGAIALYAVVTVAIAALTITGSPWVTRVIWYSLAPDLLVWGSFVYLVQAPQDAFYPAFLGITLYYVLTARDLRAWWVGLACGATYLTAHILVVGGLGAGSDLYVVWVVKAGFLPVLGYLLSAVMQSDADREHRLEESYHEIERLADQHERRLAELHAVSEISDVFHSSLDVDSMGPSVLEILRKVIDIPRASLLVIDTEKDVTVFSATDDGAAGWAVPRAVPDELGVPSAPIDDDALFSCTNLLKHDTLMVVFCAPADSLDALSDDDKVVLQAVASELATAVENSQLYKLTKKLSVTDELTGLSNYRFLQQRLVQEFDRAARYDRCLSLLMIDLDHFKDYNDEHGHLAGDGALAEFADVLRSAVREVDVVARYGGEEFSVILPETDAAGAFVAAEKVRETVAEHEFGDADGVPTEHLTVSIGVATFPDHASDREELLKQADNALYEAKHIGRDRVRAPHGPDGRSQSAI